MTARLSYSDDLSSFSNCYWGREGDEHFSCSDIDETIERILDDKEELSGTIEVAGFRVNRLCLDAESDILTPLLEFLDENYGNPDGDATEPTQIMLTAAEVLAWVIEQEYVPYVGEVVVLVSVTVADWVKEHRPDWSEPQGLRETSS